MPRDKWRSFGCRFITCDEPSGVVECGSIRRSRAKYQNLEAANLRKSTSPDKPLREAEIGPCLGGDGGPTGVQLSEVLRGTHKLNRMIEKWSRGATFDGQSKDIALDLLKGAIDLQESLILWGKLQDASKYVDQLKQKAEMSKDSRKDARMKKPRIEFDSPCDVPSTSSSQSSMINRDAAPHYHEEAAFSMAITQKGSVCRSNVIAKLMGLEEISSMKRPALDADVDRFNKPRFDVTRLGREPRPLKEILQGIQSKRILRSDSVGNWKCRHEDNPPVVLIEPLASPVVKGNEHLVLKERILRTEVMVENGKMKDETFRKFSVRQEKVDRSERKEAEEYESIRRRSKRSDRMKEGSHSKMQLPAQISKKSPQSDAVDRNPGEMQKEASRGRKPFLDPQCQGYTEPSVTRLVRTEYLGPNKMNNDTNTPKSRRQKDIRQNEIAAVECRRIEVDPVTTETSSSTLTSISVEEIDQADAVFQPLDDSKRKQGELESEDRHGILLGTKRHSEKALLWSDSTFLSHSEDLFGSFGIYPIILKSNDRNQPRSVLEKLYLDCASELIARKSLQDPRILPPIAFSSRGTGPYLTSMDKLIVEVCDGINTLNDWFEFADGHLSADGFHTLLKRDMCCDGIVNGTWDSGWKNGFSREDVEHVVIDMEKMVLGWLIEEAIAEVCVAAVPFLCHRICIWNTK